MKTVVDNLKEMAEGISVQLQKLLLNHSSIYLWNKPNDYVTTISAYGDYAYKELGAEGKQIQARLLEEYRRFYALLEVLLREQPKSATKKLSELNKLLLRTIEQEHTWCKTTQKAYENAQNALLEQLELLCGLHNYSKGEAIYVPDTNALLFNPNIESWTFDNIHNFSLVLVPAVLSELDMHKVNHRNEAVRQKSDTLINRIKEYRRRGRLTDGVNIVKGKIALLAVATEPDPKSTLPWLNLNNNDDQILGAVLELMRLYPTSPVILVTRDINLQNKAEYARIPFSEPPEV